MINSYYQEWAPYLETFSKNIKEKEEEEEGGHTSLGESVKDVSSFIISAKVPTARVYFASIGEDCIVQTILMQVYKFSLCQV